MYLLGAFVAAPIGGLLWGFGACGLRIAVLYLMARFKGHRFDALDRPVPMPAHEEVEHEGVLQPTDAAEGSGKFF